jgi:hypothetical protein
MELRSRMGAGTRMVTVIDEYILYNQESTCLFIDCCLLVTFPQHLSYVALKFHQLFSEHTLVYVVFVNPHSHTMCSYILQMLLVQDSCINTTPLLVEP